MLMIRLQRVGRKNDPAFRLVLAEKRFKPKSGELEILGSYHPKTKATILKNERILYWLSKGAKLSATAHNLLIANGVNKAKKIKVVRVKKGKAAVKKIAEPVVAEKVIEIESKKEVPAAV